MESLRPFFKFTFTDVQEALPDMKIVLIAPYQNPVVNWHWILQEVVDDYGRKGKLDGIEIDIDEGHLVESASETRDEEFLADVSRGGIKKVKRYSELNEYDAIVLTGALDPGFTGARAIAKIPVTAPIHSSVHVASLIGERCSILMASPPGALMVRHIVNRYGFERKVASVRYLRYSTTEQCKRLSMYKENKAERYADAYIKNILDDAAYQAIAAIEKERVDTFVLGCEPMLTYEDEVRRRLDEAGYEEIQLIPSLSAGISMAAAMVNMKLVKAPRAYPNDSLKAVPEFC
jgi:allantoin racemase